MLEEFLKHFDIPIVGHLRTPAELRPMPPPAGSPFSIRPRTAPPWTLSNGFHRQMAVGQVKPKLSRGRKPRQEGREPP